MQYQKQVDLWFKSKNWKAFPFQQETWASHKKGKHGLLNAPTGSGKTYALWVPILLKILEQKKKKASLQAIWITPLKALSLEIKQATEKLADHFEQDVSVDIRNGDTPTSTRTKQKRHMPDLLITTPESLQLLLASKNYDKTFENLHSIVVDEWHELLGTKRGVQVELALSRLKSMGSNLQIWGISATIGNLDQGREVLLGNDPQVLQKSELIKANIKKEIIVKSILPESMDQFPWRGHLGIQQLEEVADIIKNSRTTLLFTNTRSQCEIWFQKLLEKHPEFAGELAMHHGSINKETRIWVENAIRNESLKAVVCTSSLDLGVDFAPVETIVQIGGPKGVARFLQRAGRSGHRPGETSYIYFLPTHAIELVEASALQKAVKNQAVEDRQPVILAYDVLVQYLTTLAVSDGFFPDDIYPEIKSTFCFADLTEDEWHWALSYITYGGNSLNAYDEYKKVVIDENGKYIVQNRGIAMRHRMQIGTIVSDAILQVKYLKGGFLGSIE